MQKYVMKNKSKEIPECRISLLQSVFNKQRGQVAVEYILLLVAGVGIWMILVSLLVSRNEAEPGIVIKKWYEIIQFIGNDKIDAADYE